MRQTSPSGSDALLVIQNLRQYFPIKAGLLQKTVGHVKAVDNVSFAVSSGETVGLVGESGSGKTTVGRCIVRVYKPTDGSIHFQTADGVFDIAQLDKKALQPIRRDIQMLFQDPNSSLNARMRFGDIRWYKYHAPGQWSEHIVGCDSPSDVGCIALDVAGDARLDVVAGGVWCRNTGNYDQPFERHIFEANLEAVHDIVAADIDGCGRPEIITMSDKNDLRWYKIPADPSDIWRHQVIGPAVHAGLAVGDLDGDGDLDIVRTNVWFENINGDGKQWQVCPIGPNTYPPADFRPRFAFDGVRAVIRDMNGNGKNDIVFCDAEIPGGQVWWMENLDGVGHYWKRHDICRPTVPRRGALHSLHVGDLDGDGDLDVFSCEMEFVRGERPPRFYIWENLDGVGGDWREHVIFDGNLGGHEAVVSDLTGNGSLDIVAKPWQPHPENALDGRMFILFLENLGIDRIAQ